MINWCQSGPINITPGTQAAWVDVAGVVPAGAKGVIVEFDNNTTVTGEDYDIGLRKNGSSDDLRSKSYWNNSPAGVGSHQMVMCGVDADGVFELYVQRTDKTTVWLLGWFEASAPVVFFTNMVDKSPVADTTYKTIDIASDTGADTAVAAIVHHYQPDGNYESMGVRGIGYTGDEVYQGHWFNTTIIACNGSEQFEGKRVTGAVAAKIYLAGYLTAGFVDKDDVGPWIETMAAQVWKGNPLCDKPASATTEYIAAVCYSWYGVTPNAAGRRHPLWQGWDVRRKDNKDGAGWALLPLGCARKPETWQYDPPNQYGFIHSYLSRALVEPASKAVPSLVKATNAVESITGATETEVANYTIAWSDLTGAGFSAGDDVIIIVKTCIGGSATTGVVANFRVSRGTTFAGRMAWTDSYGLHEPNSTTSGVGHVYTWVKRHTLVVNENIYFSLQSTAGNTARSDDFACWVLSLSALSPDDWRYAETTPSGNASTTYTDGASVTLPGKMHSSWLVFGSAHWLIDSTTADVLQKLVINGVDFSEVDYEGESTAEEYTVGNLALAKGIHSDTTAKIQYRADTATTHDCNRTAVFALRLEAFASVAYDDSATTITQSVVDTYADRVTVGFHQKHASSKSVIAIGGAVFTTGDAAKQSYGRFRADGADFPSASWDRTSYTNNGTADKKNPLWLAIGTGKAQGHYDMSLQIAEDNDVSPNPTSTYGVLAVLVPERRSGAIIDQPAARAMAPLLAA